MIIHGCPPTCSDQYRPPSLRWSQLTGLSAVGNLAQRIVDLPGNQFMALMHEHFADHRAKAPLLPGEMIDVEAQVHEGRPR